MMHKWIVTPRQRCDLEMLLVGGLEPLSGFLSEVDYEHVLSTMRLSSGHIWPMPITLDVSYDFANRVQQGDEVGLHDVDNTLLAILTVSDKWKPNKLAEANAVFGTQDDKHPAVNYLFQQAGEWYLGGSVRGVKLPTHYDFLEWRHTPQSLKQFFLKSGWKNIIGFQTRNPLHRAHLELTLRAAEQYNGNILIHPVVGLTKPADVDYFTRVRCYQKLLRYYPKQNATLSLLPLAMRMAGPREALWHAIIRKNYGCTHFIVGRDHAGPGNNSNNEPFYSPYAAQELVGEHQDELGIKMVPFHEMVYVKERKHYCPSNELQPNETALSISGTQLRNALLNEEPIADWFSFPEIIQELRNSYPPKHKHGVTLFFTGLSGSGKTTLARALMAKLMSEGKRNVTLLDGDVLRRILASELGFSKADRDTNVARIGFVAAEVTKAGGMALCTVIAPYIKARKDNRHLISQFGGYIEIYVSTPLEECERRDTKGLYAKARSGELKGLTGVDDPYEPPQDADLVIDTSVMSVEESVAKIIQFLHKTNYLPPIQHSVAINQIDNSVVA